MGKMGEPEHQDDWDTVVSNYPNLFRGNGEST